MQNRLSITTDRCDGELLVTIVSVLICSDDAVLESLKSMGPAAVELELSLLTSSPTDAATDADSDVMMMFVDFLTYLFSAKRDVDLASSYLGLLLKVSC